MGNSHSLGGGQTGSHTSNCTEAVGVGWGRGRKTPNLSGTEDQKIEARKPRMWKKVEPQKGKSQRGGFLTIYWHLWLFPKSLRINKEESKQLSQREEVRTKTGAPSLTVLGCEEKPALVRSSHVLEEWRQWSTQINDHHLWLSACD